jgi:8-oxo-dGTP pyrophosphatase MutT (NUDIX family)
MFCNNCGNIGHLFKDCHFPVTSYGCILFKENKILMINRKDSLCYIDIIRGKYTLQNKNNLRLLLSRITKYEYDGLCTESFDRLWVRMWNKPLNEKCKSYQKSKALFEKLRKSDILPMINVENLYDQTEWEFPKGRRNKRETDYECAIRELQEETNVRKDDYIIDTDKDTMIEDIYGENNVPYRSIFYIGKCLNDKNIRIDPHNNEQCSEIKEIGWFTQEEALEKLRDYQNTKQTIINRLF